MQQNGVAERLNRLLMEAYRSMLQQAGLPETFWGEAVNPAVPLRNLTSAKSNMGKTPIEVLTGKVQFVGNLSCFSSEVWIFASKRKKLDANSRRGILLKSLHHRNYRVWDIQSRRVCHVRHTRINESVFPAREWHVKEQMNENLNHWIDSMETYDAYENMLRMSRLILKMILARNAVLAMCPHQVPASPQQRQWPIIQDNAAVTPISRMQKGVTTSALEPCQIDTLPRRIRSSPRIVITSNHQRSSRKHVRGWTAQIGWAL